MKWYTYLARFLALCCALVFIGSTIGLSTTFVVEGQLLQAEAYKQALIQENVYTQLPAAIIEIIAPSGQIAGLNQDSLQLVLRAILSRDWLQGQTEPIVDQLFAFLTANGQPPSFVVSLVEPKEVLNSPAGSEAILQAIRQQPACSQAQLSNFDCLNWLATDNFCRPPEEQLLSCSGALDIAIFGLSFVIPDQIDLGQYMGLSSDPATFPGSQLRPYLALVQQINQFGWLLPLLFFLFMSFFGVRSLLSWSLWWGLPLTLTGFGLIGLAIFFKTSPNFFFDIQAILGQVATFAPTLSQLLQEVVQNLLGRFVFQLTIIGLIFGTIGAIWLAIGLVTLAFTKPNLSV